MLPGGGVPVEPILSTIGPQKEAQSVLLESVITVDRDHLEPLLAALRRGGITAWDTGRRVTTEEGIDAQAEVGVRFAP